MHVVETKSRKIKLVKYNVPPPRTATKLKIEQSLVFVHISFKIECERTLKNFEKILRHISYFEKLAKSKKASKL